jgi:peptidoglycan glycosyltransferase
MAHDNMRITKKSVYSPSWRDFQKREKRRLTRQTLFRRLPKLGFPALGLLLVLSILFFTGNWLSANLPEGQVKTSSGILKQESPVNQYQRSDLPDLIGRLPLYSPESGHEMSMNGQGMKVETSVDQPLTRYINNLLDRSRTIEAAVVVLRADNGQVLALTGYSGNSEKQAENYCLKAGFPAASLFKIVASAAAIEAKGFTPDQSLTYQGGRYTLYKRQLKRRQSRYNNRVSFKVAFSRSINPVFGQIGIYDLGQELMTEYGERFLFNQSIPFDLPLSSSFLEVPEDDFGLAEIASGFNKRTTISPLHVAMITASIINKGIMMQPWIVSKITNGSDQILYQNQVQEIARPITDHTAQQLKILMRDTVKTGTCRRAFAGLSRKKTYKSIDFGAKTGTINDLSDQHKVDWTAAYALPEKGGHGVAIAVLAVHGELLGIRAKDIAGNILQYYLKKS